jgi:chaperonin GroES
MASEIKIQPIGNRVLVQPEEIEDKTPGGLVIPPSANDDKRPAMGSVVKLGIGKNKHGKDVSFDVKVGDKVFFSKYSPDEVEMNGDTYLLLKAEDILAVIK